MIPKPTTAFEDSSLHTSAGEGLILSISPACQPRVLIFPKGIRQHLRGSAKSPQSKPGDNAQRGSRSTAMCFTANFHNARLRLLGDGSASCMSLLTSTGIQMHSSAAISAPSPQQAWQRALIKLSGASHHPQTMDVPSQGPPGMGAIRAHV